ncbi:MAG TPA: hypothetical protein VMB50_22270 [Myxococcales bacterium]|jgi:hypothetical protein|nr:hypothetical protein [Myxococcales bacterium]
MTRLAIFYLLGCSFLTVQAHVIRERALRRESQIVAHHTAGSGERPAATLGGGTTRAISEAQDPSRQPPAAAAAPALPQIAFVGGGPVSRPWVRVAAPRGQRLILRI